MTRFFIRGRGVHAFKPPRSRLLTPPCPGAVSTRTKRRRRPRITATERISQGQGDEAAARTFTVIETSRTLPASRAARDMSRYRPRDPPVGRIRRRRIEREIPRGPSSLPRPGVDDAVRIRFVLRGVGDRRGDDRAGPSLPLQATSVVISDAVHTSGSPRRIAGNPIEAEVQFTVHASRVQSIGPVRTVWSDRRRIGHPCGGPLGMRPRALAASQSD